MSMSSTPTITFLCGAVALSASSIAFASPPKEEHFDLWLQAADGPSGPHIVTGSITEGTPISEIERVFGAELGKDVAFPFSTDEPGLQALAGPLTAGMTWSFNIVSALGQWNGSDGFTTPSETMLIEFGPASAQTDGGFVGGFNFTGQPDGLLHEHFEFTLQGGTLGGADPADGIYLLTLEFLGVNGTTSYAASDPVFLVFNLNMSEEAHDEAIQWVQDNLVPAPGVMAMLMGFGLIRSRRRRSLR
jgi:hypothetical protein